MGWRNGALANLNALEALVQSLLCCFVGILLSCNETETRSCTTSDLRQSLVRECLLRHGPKDCAYLVNRAFPCKELLSNMHADAGTQ